MTARRSTLYKELRRKYATKERDQGQETKFHLTRITWAQFFETVTNTYSKERKTSIDKNFRPRQIPSAPTDQGYGSRPSSQNEGSQDKRG